MDRNMDRIKGRIEEATGAFTNNDRLKKEGAVIARNRRYTMFQRILGTLLIMVLWGTIAGCNTFRGLGQDIERAGEKTQDAADNVKKRM